MSVLDTIAMVVILATLLGFVAMVGRLAYLASMEDM